MKDRSIFQRMGPYMATYLLLGLAIPALLYTLIMGLLGWQVPSFGPGGSISYAGARKQSVYVYEAQASSEHFARIGGNYENLLKAWRNYFETHKRSHRVLKTPAEVAKLQGGVLILPSALALSDAERMAILSFHAKGGSVLATWATGTRDAQGQWIGWDFLNRLGATSVAQASAPYKPSHYLLHGEAPVSHSQPAGQRVSLSPVSESPLLLKGPHVAARFAAAGSTDDFATDHAAVLYAEGPAAAGRTVLFAFAESAWENRPFPTEMLIEDALLWLSHQSTIVKAAWPHAKLAAQAFSLDASLPAGAASSDAATRMAQQAQHFAEGLREAGMPGTVFAQASLIKSQPRTLRNLGSEIELAYLGEPWDAARGPAGTAQKAQLDSMRQDASADHPGSKPFKGYRDSADSLDKARQPLLQAMGVRYQLAGPAGATDRLPAFTKTVAGGTAEDLLLLRRTQRDDLLQTGTVASIASAWQNDLTQVIEQGSLGWLALHGASLDGDGPVAPAFAQHLAAARKLKSTVWFTNGAQLNQWWRERDRVTSGVNYDGKRLDFSVTVKGDTPVSGATFVLMLPARQVTPVIRAVKVGVELPALRPLDEFRTQLIFEFLKPGNYNYTITF